jgi:hypothetical protein
MSLAPIILFVYNRPEHTRLTLNALAENIKADQTELFIFCDGPKPNASDDTLEKIKAVRSLVREKLWCRQVSIVERDTNYGLSKSIIYGVTEIINQYGKAIMLEDDIVTTRLFLTFMNEALTLYEDKGLAGVSGWAFPIKVDEPSYFSRIGSCWGWGTWKKTWQQTEWNADKLMSQLSDPVVKQEFDADGRYPYFKMLESQSLGLNDSWAIRFYASFFVRKELFLFSSVPLAVNIGMDGTGVHYTNSKERALFAEIKLGDLSEVVLKLETPAEKTIIRKQIVNSYHVDVKAKNDRWNIINYLLNSVRNVFN